MSSLPAIPHGTGKHPIGMVVINATDLARAVDFYRKVFKWELEGLSPQVAAGATPGMTGPTVALRVGMGAAHQGVVPFLGVPDVVGALDAAVAAGGSVEHAPWDAPMVGKLARFADPSGTVYGLVTGTAPAPARIPPPFGDNPRPPANDVCSIEMYAADHAATAAFFGSLFGWGTVATMPHYLGFDTGAGIGGVFQSHAPAARGVPYIHAPDVGATLDAIDAAGGARQGGVLPVPGLGSFGYFNDPSGTMMGLIGG
ncbi:MAG TPA: VOC family protein [Gemmatimonadales bacterium]|jgi:hypothetical protein|nr:VOC family protein [Gemmatimonadales bacterium]